MKRIYIYLGAYVVGALMPVALVPGGACSSQNGVASHVSVRGAQGNKPDLIEASNQIAKVVFLTGGNRAESKRVSPYAGESDAELEAQVKKFSQEAERRKKVEQEEQLRKNKTSWDIDALQEELKAREAAQRKNERHKRAMAVRRAKSQGVKMKVRTIVLRKAASKRAPQRDLLEWQTQEQQEQQANREIRLAHNIPTFNNTQS